MPRIGVRHVGRMNREFAVRCAAHRNGCAFERLRVPRFGVAVAGASHARVSSLSAMGVEGEGGSPRYGLPLSCTEVQACDSSLADSDVDASAAHAAPPCIPYATPAPERALSAYR